MEDFMKNIVFDHVDKAYGKNVIVKDLNLEIKEGERLILLGPSGCLLYTSEQRELALEQLLEILRESRCRRRPTVTGEEHTISGMIDWPDRRAGQWGMEHSVSVLTECMRLIMN